MNARTLRGGVAATAVIFTLAAAAAVPNQDSKPVRTQDRFSSDKSWQAGQNEMEPIANAYANLHQATLDMLQQKARSWKDTKSKVSESAFESPSTGSGDSAGSSTGSASTSGSPSSISLQGDDLLIAACSKGLLAGAPTRSFPSSSNAKAGSSTQDDLSTGANRMGQTVGMLLVCAHSSNDSRGSGHASTDGSEDRSGDRSGEGAGEAEEASSPREPGSQDRGSLNASPDGKLKPGVFCVKQSGNSVWLTDENGQVVLRSTIDMAAHSGGARDASSPNASGKNAHQSWEQIFTAITMDAVTSMGWAKEHEQTSMR